ncbi:hypothetical protein HMPREF9554_00412 [Treponema phagedenis F0421]|nr:hypothetical protein HMPREF9554_00412 [Treponema phagedenis F0421]
MYKCIQNGTNYEKCRSIFYTKNVKIVNLKFYRKKYGIFI